MTVKVTLTKIIRKDTSAGKNTTGDQFLSFQNMRFFSGQSSNLAIEDVSTGDIYQTDFAYSGVAAVLEAAATTGGTFTLT